MKAGSIWAGVLSGAIGSIGRYESHDIWPDE